jgi:hypothetical protein
MIAMLVSEEDRVELIERHSTFRQTLPQLRDCESRIEQYPDAPGLNQHRVPGTPAPQ